jgi:hypothetical protein
MTYGSTDIYDTGASAPFPPPVWPDPPPPGWPRDRDTRVAAALRIRIERIGEEIADLEESRERLSDALAVVERRRCWGRA